jgi:short-subunit dehydrogenase
MSQSKVAVVMGAGPGLGAAVAHRFAQSDFAVALMARTEEKLTQIQICLICFFSYSHICQYT